MFDVDIIPFFPKPCYNPIQQILLIIRDFNFMEGLQGIYKSLRNALLSIFIYFILQAILLLAIGVLIVVYPFALIVLVSLFFLILAIMSLVIAWKVKCYHGRLKKIKEAVFGS